jgi:hypothetical protein
MAKMIEFKSELTEHNVVLVTWQLKPGEDAKPFSYARAGIMTVAAAGNFSGGAKLAFAGSNDAVAWHKIADPLGRPIVFDKPGMARPDQWPVDVRPEIAGGDKDTAVTLTLAIRRH